MGPGGQAVIGAALFATLANPTAYFGSVHERFGTQYADMRSFGSRVSLRSMSEEPSADAASDGESTLAAPAAPRLVTSDGVFSGVEDERLFTELRARMFARATPLEVGRYQILRQLGAGAMGEVLLARDTELDRLVALKFVHAHLASPRWTEGLKREARALARLAHDKVVRVYEVGEHRGQVYLAMEFIEGGSLREWMRAESPSWDEVLAAYLDAARGLAAAHGAGIIHSDFKPDNVLRSDAGRVAVADFGLASISLYDASESSGAEQTQRGDIPTYSRPGEVKGTPAYMPPEQYAGYSDARSDQFALCVALYDGLWGRRPFSLGSFIETQAGLVNWTPAPPPKGKPAPRWLWPILRRGLAEDPAARWPDVDVLIAVIEGELQGRRRRRRRLISGAVALGVGVSSGLSVAFLVDAEVEDCSALAVELDPTWGEAAREELLAHHRELAASPGRAWIEASGERVGASLDIWRERWLSSRVALCEAGVGGDPRVLERHASCLEHERQRAAAIVGFLQAGKVRTLAEGPRAVARLADPLDCAAQARGGGPPPPPPAKAEAVEAIRAGLAELEAELATAHYGTGLSHAADWVARAELQDYAPVVAEALYLYGEAWFLNDQVEPAFARLEEAADVAETSRHDRVVARSWARMAAIAASRVEDLERGHRWLRRAEAAQSRVGAEPKAEASLALVHANLTLAADDFEAASTQLADVLATFEGQGSLLEASHASESLGRAWLERHDEGQALARFEQALALREQVYGPAHPAIARVAFKLGQVAYQAGRAGLARRLFERAIEIWSGAEELRSRDAGDALFLLAQIELWDSEFEAAIHHAQSAAGAFEQGLPAADIRHSEVAVLLATAHYFLGHAESSVEAWELGVAGYATAHGPDDSFTAVFRVGLGWAQLLAGQPEAARQAFTRGRAAIEITRGDGSEDAVDARLGLIAVELASGDAEAAAAGLASFDAPPSSDENRFSYELFRALTGLRLDSGAPGKPTLAALSRFHTFDERTEISAAFRAVLLDSVNAAAGERARLSR